MRMRTAALVGLCLALGFVSTTLAQRGGRTADGRDVAVVGRYQLAIAGPGAGLYMTDTATGDCWNQINAGEWTSIGNPRVKPDEGK